MMEHLMTHFPALLEEAGLRFGGMRCTDLESFSYEDPMDGSLSENQGIVLSFEGGERAIFRLSGTGSEGATIRLYLEKYEKDAAKHGATTAAALQEVAAAALEASNLVALTGRESPTVIT
jgi:phosphoglucomutase